MPGDSGSDRHWRERRQQIAAIRAELYRLDCEAGPNDLHTRTQILLIETLLLIVERLTP